MGKLARLLRIGDGRRDLVADLGEAYRAEAEQAIHLRQQAERARYPQVAATLRQLAEAEDRHAAWLRERIVALGGDIPPLAPPPLPGRNQWERAVAGLRVAQQKRKRLVDQIAHWDPEQPEAVELLRRIEQEDQGQLPVLEHVVMRSDPQAID
ncbi:MAG TPA: ferritin family protein [Candidatus Binatia bacterium]|nr:ferritin family protein [Candidatus Binatia bacterium]